MNSTLRIFIIIFAMAALAAASAWLLRTNTEYAPPETQVPAAPRAPARFSWSFRDTGELNLDGNSMMNVVLTVTYSSGSRAELVVDTVDGGCSEIAGESHEGDESGAGKVQCYYAGLGQRYRVREVSSTHFVERQTFEEGTPDVTPEEQPWEAVAQVPR